MNLNSDTSSSISKSDETPSANTPQDFVGQIIAEHWKITDFLGEGSMSYVYKAQNLETGKIVALKLIRENLLQRAADPCALEKQARTFIALNHENIASYYNLHLNSNRQLFLFCDFLQGESLANLLSKQSKLSLEDSIEIFKQIAAGLEYAHEKKIWHGDLRPSNIFIVNDQFSVDEAKIVDFALMHLVAHSPPKGKEYTTVTLPALGNAPYMSPEQRTGGNIDGRSDLYSVGCLMYEAVIGKPPFIGSSAMATTYKQKQQTTIPLDQILPAHPLLSRYQVIVSKLLKDKKEQRYQSAGLLKADLDLISTADENAWRRKANVCKKSKYSTIIAYRRPILICVLILILIIIPGFKLATIIYPYCQPWSGSPRFDDNKLWIVQNKQQTKISPVLLKRKELLASAVLGLKQANKQAENEYARTLFTYAQILLNCGDWNQAQSALIELQNITSPNNAIGSPDILANLAYVKFMLLDPSSAEQYARHSLALAGQSNKYLQSKIMALKILADISTQKNAHQEAKANYEQIHNLASKFRLNDPVDYAYSCALLADIYRQEHKLDQSEKLYKEAIDWGENYMGHDQLFIAKAFYGLALVQYQQGNLTAARKELSQSLPIAISCQGPDSDFVAAIKALSNYLQFHTNILDWVKSQVPRPALVK